ncbi:MAG: carbohydrate binding domain-containing protein [Spirochaetota bacterium]|mgnify:FL=1
MGKTSSMRLTGFVFIIVSALFTVLPAIAAESDAALFPFVLPWDDSSPGIANISGWLHKPAGKFGTLRAGEDGHIYAGKERIRLRGVDITHAANFPTKEDAEKIAARMAKFGINIVRFHHMDQYPFPRGLYLRDSKHTRVFDPEALDRMDYYIAQLKKNGIYTYLCLLNYRPISAADGLPKEIEQAKGNSFQGRHAIGFFDKQIIDLQKEFAHNLLTHTNAYTGKPYTEEPAVAFVEVNNENGLFHILYGGIGNSGGIVGTFPELYLTQLRGLWNDWLMQKYGSDDRLRSSWNMNDSEAIGDEMIRNLNFAAGIDQWLLEQNAGAGASVSPTDDMPPNVSGKTMLIEVTKPGTQSWHIRFEQRDIAIAEGRMYTLDFWAKADSASTMDVCISMNRVPWKVLGMMNTMKLTPVWQRFHFVSRMGQADDTARLVFDPQMKKGSFWIAGVSLKPGGATVNTTDERLEGRRIPLVKGPGELTASAQRDWLTFLWDTEDRYWKTMKGYIKNDLGTKAMVIGTIVGCSTPNLMAQFDAIDSHGYWQHPAPWNSNNFTVGYASMVNDLGGLIPNLALRSVVGKPFCITEYAHCAPNTFVSEGDLIRGAYAGLQDWDYLSTSRFAHEARWDLGSICNFIDIDQHPTRMITLIPAGAMYLRGDVRAAKETVCTSITKDREIDILRTIGGRWDAVQGGHAGIPHATPLKHRTLIAVEDRSPPAGTLRPEQVTVGDDRIISDTGELDWDLRKKQRGVVTVNTAGSKAVIGYSGGNRYELGDVTIEPGPTRQDGWSAITVTRMEGDSSKGSRWLITATGYVENSKKGWTVVVDRIVGKENSWGEGPTMVEGIPARVSMPSAASRTEAWALDERGQRKTKVDIAADAKGNAVISIGPKHRTLWYEIGTR